jgi:hypothetical protein
MSYNIIKMEYQQMPDSVIPDIKDHNECCEIRPRRRRKITSDFRIPSLLLRKRPSVNKVSKKTKQI